MVKKELEHVLGTPRKSHVEVTIQTQIRDQGTALRWTKRDSLQLAYRLKTKTQVVSLYLAVACTFFAYLLVEFIHFYNFTINEL